MSKRNPPPYVGGYGIEAAFENASATGRQDAG